MLRRLGCVLELAENGEEALARISATDFDLVLMDCQMPVMDGLSATRAQRAREGAGARRVPIVALTAHAMQGDRERCLAAGTDDYLAKPVQREELERLLERWVPGRFLPSAVRARRRPAVAEEEVLDAGVLASLKEIEADGMPGLVAEVVDLFGTQGRRLLDQLEAAAGCGDAVAWRSALHALKGSAGSVGATVLAARCRALEEAAVSPAVLEPPTIAELRTEYGRAMGALALEGVASI
jgi:CheY-like chemotaxis protein